MTTEMCSTHDWQPTEEHDVDEQHRGFECSACSATTHGCNECGRPMGSSLLVCDRCVQRAQRVVRDVAQWMAEHTFGVTLVTLRAVRYDRDRPATEDDARLPFGLDAVVPDPEETRIGASKHPDDAVAVLESWARDWAGQLGDDEAAVDALPYLVEHTLWAMQNRDASGWSDYIEEARQVRAVVRRLLGIAPVPERVPCVHCGGRIVREWTNDGLDDVRRCTGCGMEWKSGLELEQHTLAALQALPTSDPETLATREQIRRLYPHLRAGTLREWIRRGHVPQRGTNARGEPVYRLGDLAARLDQPAKLNGGSVA
jgi:hypothetical protein